MQFNYLLIRKPDSLNFPPCGAGHARCEESCQSTKFALVAAKTWIGLVRSFQSIPFEI